MMNVKIHIKSKCWVASLKDQGGNIKDYQFEVVSKRIPHS